MIDIGIMQLETWTDSTKALNGAVPVEGLSLSVSRWVDGRVQIGVGLGAAKHTIVSLTESERRELVEFLSEGLE